MGGCFASCCLTAASCCCLTAASASCCCLTAASASSACAAASAFAFVSASSACARAACARAACARGLGCTDPGVSMSVFIPNIPTQFHTFKGSKIGLILSKPPVTATLNTAAKLSLICAA